MALWPASSYLSWADFFADTVAEIGAEAKVTSEVWFFRKVQTKWSPTAQHVEEAPWFIDDGDACLGSDRKFYLVKRNTDEVQWNKLSPEQEAKFRTADAAEWASVVGANAVRVLTVEESRKVEKDESDRIMGSRMVRRYKPLDEGGHKEKTLQDNGRTHSSIPAEQSCPRQ